MSFGIVHLLATIIVAKVKILGTILNRRISFFNPILYSEKKMRSLKMKLELLFVKKLPD